ncbi:Predicted ATPase [Kaistia soli DSM 19436]|uniref:histidine kinase n=1 Tax=Kaistia soli DSM 19436 TaxID=1122133 RepID=A0A1M5DJE6_9HYPH|nr:AAA family ATPase [Kaistia soli]SHF67097.1 Predicted ATPase [Kaistia soli DSM 19436]
MRIEEELGQPGRGTTRPGDDLPGASCDVDNVAAPGPGLDRIDGIWWSRLAVSPEGTEDGVDIHLGREPDGQSWRILSTAHGTPAAARLEHEAALVSLLDITIAELPQKIGHRERVILVYPARDAATLADIAAGTLPLERFIDLALAAARSLTKLHALGIVHGSLHPARVLVDNDGSLRFAGFGRSLAAALPPITGDEALSVPDIGYAAPERARRQDPHCDARSDLYALGVILYEVLTGSLPLQANSIAAWLHAHVAIAVPPPSLVRTDTPPGIDAILLKLIAKDPDDRYQSADTLLADLQHARALLSGTGTVDVFAVGRGDLSPRTSLSKRLFGRERERADLVAAVGRVRQLGRMEVVFISGEAGMGKSALVEQLSKILPADFQFAIGKSDLLQKDIPYAPFTQALGSLIGRILSENAAVLQSIRARLIADLAGYGRLLVDMVPEAAFVLGDSAPLPDASATLTQLRIGRVILQAVAAIARPEAPLVLFLDDLQWADDASLAVVKSFLSEAPPHVLLMGSYRTEELADRPDLVALLASARSGSVPALELTLRPLSSADMGELLASALDSASADVAPLADIIHRKTHGNAFYVGQLLRKLVDEKILSFDTERQRWAWDQSRLGQQRSIGEFMLHRLDGLPEGQREFLRLLACAGGRCSPALLERLLGRRRAELDEIAGLLTESGLLVHQGADYAAAHDRVLEAAYALTPEEDRPAAHTAIARQLIALYGDDHAELAFDIASQIERGERTMLSEAERLSFVRILSAAGRRARRAGAIPRAASYLLTARGMMPPEWRGSHQRLFFDVELLHCDCLLALSAADEALRAIDGLLEDTSQPLDRAEAFRLKAIAHTIQSDYRRAIDAALAGLELLGIDLDRSPDPEHLRQAYLACRAKLDRHTMAEIAALPEMQDATRRSALSLLSTLIASAFVDGELRFLHVIKIVELTLDHGMTPESAYGLAWFGVFSAHHYEAYEDGAAYAAAAVAIARRDGYEAQRTAALIALDQVAVWTKPLGFALARAREAAAAGQAAGDLGMACYARNHVASDLLILGEPLRSTRAEIEEGLIWTRQINYRDIELILGAQLRLVDTLVSGDYDAGALVPPDPIVSIPTQFWVHLYAGITAFFFGDIDRAILDLEASESLIGAVPAHIDGAGCRLFLALAIARSPRARTDPKDAIARMAGARARFAAWRTLNPATFASKSLLLEAEATRLAGHGLAAQKLYAQAAEAALASGFIHEQALAHELAARHLSEEGLDIAAQGYALAAIRLYRQWGADGKVAHLHSDFPWLRDEIEPPSQQNEGQSALDLAAMTKSAQVLAEEVGLEPVIRTLMREMIIHAGAQTGLLLLIHDDEPLIEATARVEHRDVKVDIRTSPPTDRDLPLAVLNTVMRTRKAVVFGDALAELPHLRKAGSDERGMRSLLCLPLIKRGVLVGVLHLENSLAANVFTPDRTAMLEVLAPQAAISLDTARLYRDLVDENTLRAQAEISLREARSELARTSQMTAMGSFAASIAHEINQPLATVVANADAAIRWLNRAEPDLGEAMSGLESIRAAGLRAAGIVKSLRSLAKRAPAAFSPVRLEAVAEDVLRLTSNELETHQVTVVRRMGASRGVVLADPVQLQQVIFNLITNAIHAMEATPLGEKRLVVETTHQEGSICLAISDTGSGIADDMLQRIFEPFFTTKNSGMGVGLAICRSIIEAHGGALEVRSRRGEGTAFSFTLGLMPEPHQMGS